MILKIPCLCAFLSVQGHQLLTVQTLQRTVGTFQDANFLLSTTRIDKSAACVAHHPASGASLAMHACQSCR